MRRWRFLIAVLAVAAAPQVAQAQGYPVTAGEHAGFTRIVVHAPPGITWRLGSDGRDHRVSIEPARDGLDLGRLFDRIARTRLAAASDDGGTLTLSLGCDCPVTAWEERPGLVVIDIADAPAPDNADPPQPSGTPPGAASPPLSVEAARRIGATLAQRHAADASAASPARDAPTAPPDPDALSRGLGLPIAHALSQGLLDPATDRPAARASLLRGAPQGGPPLPENLRIATVLDRPDPAAAPEPPPPADCRPAEALSFLHRPDAGPFTETYAQIARRLYGEFDQPDPDARRQLIELYLASGFGAEARRLLEAATDPVAGRDLLLGLADLLEGRNSNSRMRLARMIDCGGPAAIFALLAGPADAVPAGHDLALAFAQLPAGLRAIIGADLVERMIAADNRDAARIVAESLRRSPWTDPSMMAVIDAALARARGLDSAAAARLDALPPGGADSLTVRRRLDLALDAGLPVTPAYLAGAEAIASAERGGETGPDLMATLVRLHAREASLAEGFAVLDRLASWLPATGGNRRLLDDLTDTLWHATAARGDDLALLRAVLERDDWRGGALTPATRSALAARLADLGLAPPVEALLPDPQNAEDAALRARAALARGDAHAALALVDGYQTDPARATRAAALEALGAAAAASDVYRDLGATGAALRSARAAGDWDRLRQIQAAMPPEGAGAPAAGATGLDALLGRRPGHSPVPGGPNPDGSPGDGAAPAAPGTAPRAGPDTVPDAPPGVADAAGGPAAAPEPAADPEPATGRSPAADANGDVLPQPQAAGHGSEDDAIAFDRLGLVSRGAVLLSESERLRAAIAPLLEDRP